MCLAFDSTYLKPNWLQDSRLTFTKLCLLELLTTNRWVDELLGYSLSSSYVKKFEDRAPSSFWWLTMGSSLEWDCLPSDRQQPINLVCSLYQMWHNYYRSCHFYYSSCIGRSLPLPQPCNLNLLHLPRPHCSPSYDFISADTFPTSPGSNQLCLPLLTADHLEHH